MGLNAIIESREVRSQGYNLLLGTYNTSLGSIKILNRNIDLIELEGSSGGWGEYDIYRCTYEVWAEVEGVEGKLKVELKPIHKGLFRSEIANFKWVEKVWESYDLAKTVSEDDQLREMLFLIRDQYFLTLETEPDNANQCIRILPKRGWQSPESAFPTIETFEAYDRIAHHLRHIAAVRLLTRTETLYESPLKSCGNCAFYLSANCPRGYAKDNELWRKQDPCDLFRLRRQTRPT
jgi:hypothetical protein